MIYKNNTKPNFNINSICILFKYKMFIGNIGKIKSKKYKYIFLTIANKKKKW